VNIPATSSCRFLMPGLFLIFFKRNSRCHYGMQLYSADGLRLNLEYIDLNPATTFSQAQKYYYDRFGMALGFFEAANTCYENGFYKNCLFLLNHAVEEACKSTIRVYVISNRLYAYYCTSFIIQKALKSTVLVVLT
jgi:hypothetical protein